MPASIPLVHLPNPKRVAVARARDGGRAHRLNEKAMPGRTSAADMLAIVDWLRVEKMSRYLPKATSTWCNIYAYDVCCLAGVYLPRVWWTDRALEEISAGRQVPVRYEKTVVELSANSLYNWLEHWSSSFGWSRETDVGRAQAHANAGGLGVVCAATLNPRASGHISVIVPESPRRSALNKDGQPVAPVQSQAGATNRALFSTAWWTRKGYRAWGMWLVD